MTRPPFPTVIDSSIIATFRSCEWKSWLEYFLNWKPRSPSIHLHAGKCYAAGLEAARIAFHVQHHSAERAIEIGLNVLRDDWGNFDAPFDSPKSLTRMLGALEFYFEHYPLAEDAAQPIMLGDRIGIEFSFAEPLGVEHPETGEPIILAGRADQIVSYAGGTYIEDDKTASQLGASWSRQWDLRSQFTHYCLTGDHEVLTPEGWVRLDSLRRGVKVAQWDRGEISFALPTEYHQPHFSGKLEVFQGKTNFVCTPEHRIPFYDAYSKTYGVEVASKLSSGNGSLRLVSAGMKRDGTEYETRFLRLLAAIQADGSWVRNSAGDVITARFHFKKRRKFERLLELLTGLPHNKTVGKDYYSVRLYDCEELSKAVSLLGPLKKWGSWLLSLNGESLKVLVNELPFWDGTVRQPNNSRRNGLLYCSSDQENAEWVCTISALCNGRGVVHVQEHSNGYLMYRVSWSARHHHSIHLHKREQIEYSGPVYCLSVPSSYFLVRRSGRIVVTGNCWAAAKMGIRVDGVLVRGVSILKTKYDTQECVTYRPQWMIERGIGQLERDILRMIEAWKSGAWNMNLDHACTEYGGCTYRQICLVSDPAPFLDTGFERRSWNPITRVETVLG